MRFTGLVILIVISVTGCQKNMTDSSGSLGIEKIQADEILGSYTFDLYEGKSLLVKNHGSFVIDHVDGDVFTGTWQIDSGSSGNVFCTQENGTLYIHLDIPGLLPQEYLLIGTLTDGAIAGQWRFNVEVFSMQASGDWFRAVITE